MCVKYLRNSDAGASVQEFMMKWVLDGAGNSMFNEFSEATDASMNGFHIQKCLLVLKNAIKTVQA